MGIERARSMRKRSRLTAPGPKTARVRHRLPVGKRGVLELWALQGFRMIFGSARRFDAEVRRTTGVPGSLLWALSEIASAADMSINALANRMALHQTTASNIVNALVERKLVLRRRNAADQRVVELQVSAHGTRVLRRAPGPHAGLLVDALKCMKAHQLEGLQQNLMLLVAEMRRPARGAAGETLLGE
jgi:MarR family transcriptional regulator, organic hydroperoxide resistance regulator